MKMTQEQAIAYCRYIAQYVDKEAEQQWLDLATFVKKAGLAAIEADVLAGIYHVPALMAVSNLLYDALFDEGTRERVLASEQRRYAGTPREESEAYPFRIYYLTSLRKHFRTVNGELISSLSQAQSFIDALDAEPER